MNTNPNLVSLSKASSVILSRLNISLTKSEIMQIGKGTDMILSVGRGESRHEFVAIEEFLNHLSEVFHAPDIDTAKEDRRKDKAKRYSEVTRELMQRMFTLLFKDTKHEDNKLLFHNFKEEDSEVFLTLRERLRAQLFLDLRDNKTIKNSQQENTLFGNRELLFHLVSFFKEKDRDAKLESIARIRIKLF